MSQVMKLKRLEVKNYRSIQDQVFILHDLSVLLGRNNSGKSNVLDAIATLLEGTAKSVDDADFLDKEQPLQLNGEFHNVASFLPLCSEKNRKKVESMIGSDGVLRLRRRYGHGVEKPGALVSYDAVSGEDCALATGIDAEFKRLLPEVVRIGTLADVADEATGKNTSALGKLLGHILEGVRTKAQPELDKAFVIANRLLNKVGGKDDRVDELKEVEEDITELLTETFAGISVHLTFTLPDVRRLLADAGIDVDDGHITPFFRKGHGVQRALYLSLLRALAKRGRDRQEESLHRPLILLFEEPELFLHPSAQEQMREALSQISHRNQVVIATHAPTMVSLETLKQLVLIRKVAAKRDANDERPPYVTVSVPQEAVDTSDADEKDLLHILNLHRASRAFFFGRVILVEGPSDVHLLNAITVQAGRRKLEYDDCAVIETGGKDKLLTFQKLLSSLGIKVVVLADDDFLWRGAGHVFKTDPEYSKFCQAVAKYGEKSNAKRNGLAMDVALREQAAVLRSRLAASGIFVLSHGNIEHYVGLSENSKGDFVLAAKDIANGTRPVSHLDEFKDIFKSILGA
jgi:putative ATP-dependent endonuclease of the OLD family